MISQSFVEVPRVQSSLAKGLRFMGSEVDRKPLDPEDGFKHDG